MIRAVNEGDAFRIESVSALTGDGYSNKLIPKADFERDVREVLSGGRTFDASPRLFRLATEALRTHLAHAFDPQFAVSVSQVDPLPHQIEAVYKRILPLPRIRFLLADDPGAGKTIMAGLLMRELMQRHDVKRVLVLCPKAITDQWRREMWDRFKERFLLLTGEVMAATFGGNPWLDNDLVIASVDFAAQEHIRPSLEQATWDLIVFDEAHKLSAYQYAGKVDKTRRYQLAEAIGDRTRHLLLMTATPHRGDPANFRLLLALLDRDVFASQSGAQEAIDPDNSPFFLRRMKETMRDWDNKPLFLPRHVLTPPYDLNPHEFDLYEEVTDYVRTGMELADQSAESRVRRNVGLALTILQRRLASSLFAVTRSLERRQDKLTAALQMLREGGGVASTLAGTTEEFDEEEDDTDEIERAVSGASAATSAEQLEAEIEQLKLLVAHARRAMALGPERKVEELQRVIREATVAEHDEKILIFTEHRDTLEYLTTRLREWGHSVVNIHGGMQLPARIAAEKAFRGDAQFLVATDAAGEGINLQFCRVMINWDLPWNPNRLEQRMGRIHRYGQKFEVQIFNLVAMNTREGQVLARLMLKLDRMRDALGHDQVYDVIQQVLDTGQIRLDTLFREAILNRRTLDDILADFDALETEAAKAAARDALGEALATQHIDMTFLLGEERESKERRLTPEFVERFFVDGFEYLGGKLAKRRDQTYRLEKVPTDLRKLAQASNTGETGAENRPITFRKERASSITEQSAEFLAPDHPLFDAVTEKVLAAGRQALAQGTVFIDSTAREAYLVWLLEVAARNGMGTEVHRRLLGLRQSGEAFDAVEPGVLLDLTPSDTAPVAPDNIRTLADADRARSEAGKLYAYEYLARVREQQEREVDIVSKALESSLADQLAHLQADLERQNEQKEAGRDMDIAIRTTSLRIDDLLAERDLRRKDLAHRRVVSLDAPKVVGVAAVLPGPIPVTWEKGGAGGGDTGVVERAGMDIAMDYERANGRNPEDVSKRGVGYDIKSTAPDGSVRYIEAKAHTTTGDVTLYYTERQMAERMGEEFFIYEVNYALTDPQLRIVQDPVGKGIEFVEKVVEYRIAAAAMGEHSVLVEFRPGSAL
ncbi:MAG: DUF3883 domain-containing protein [Dehalococcoidia bacterium]|nr:DUF3883 domain-containing protein [Dehalococcoidia bacterium]